MNLVIQCASGTNFITSADPRADAKKTINCGFTKPMPASAGWSSYSDSLDMVHLDKNPSEPSQIEASSTSPYDEYERELAVRSFLDQDETHARAAARLYDVLLAETPPDNTVLNNLNAGQTMESQVVYIAAGDRLFAQSNNDNRTFVVNVYHRLVEREPAQWELDTAVQDLNGYWFWVDDPCPQECYYLVDGGYYCDPPPPRCGHWEWYQKSRSDFAWEIVGSHEFDQVLARYMYGIQLRRTATAFEIEDQAYFVGCYGMKEGGVRLLKSLEYFNKSTQPW